MQNANEPGQCLLEWNRDLEHSPRICHTLELCGKMHACVCVYERKGGGSFSAVATVESAS